LDGLYGRVRWLSRIEGDSSESKIEPPTTLIAIGHPDSAWQRNNPAVEIDLGNSGEQGLALACSTVQARDQFIAREACLAQDPRIEPIGIGQLRAHELTPERHSIPRPEIIDDLIVGSGARANGSHLSVAFGQIDVEVRRQRHRRLGMKRGTGKHSANRRRDHPRKAHAGLSVSDGIHIPPAAPGRRFQRGRTEQTPPVPRTLRLLPPRRTTSPSSRMPSCRVRSTGLQWRDSRRDKTKLPGSVRVGQKGYSRRPDLAGWTSLQISISDRARETEKTAVNVK
jgi:hypothetical protein